MPPGTKPPRKADAMAKCLFRLETYDVWLRRGEGMTFIHFTPRETERCGLQPEVMDPGASYAISDEGGILKRDGVAPRPPSAQETLREAWGARARVGRRHPRRPRALVPTPRAPASAQPRW
jgi:hypothetical protein